VANITSDTALTVTVAWGATASGQALKSAATRFARTFSLENVRSIRFKYRLRLMTTDDDESPVVYGVVVAYLPIPEPNWMWEFVVVCSSKQELLDGTTETVDVAARAAYLDNLFRSQELFTFVDIDGGTWTINGKGCFLYDYARMTAVPGEPTSSNPLEGDLRVVILEAVESY
jgi:hypothetical protein